MKNLIKLFGIIAIVAIIGLSIAACGDDNPFIGKWSGQGLTVTCTETTWSTSNGLSGTYTPNGNTADFVQSGGGIFGTATVSGDTMTVKGTGGNYTLTKQ